MSLLRTKSIEQTLQDADQPEHQLKRYFSYSMRRSRLAQGESAAAAT